MKAIQPYRSSCIIIQHEILRRVEGLFALADPLEARLTKARGQAETQVASTSV